MFMFVFLFVAFAGLTEAEPMCDGVMFKIVHTYADGLEGTVEIPKLARTIYDWYINVETSGPMKIVENINPYDNDDVASFSNDDKTEVMLNRKYKVREMKAYLFSKTFKVLLENEEDKITKITLMFNIRLHRVEKQVSCDVPVDQVQCPGAFTETGRTDQILSGVVRVMPYWTTKGMPKLVIDFSSPVGDITVQKRYRASCNEEMRCEIMTKKKKTGIKRNELIEVTMEITLMEDKDVIVTNVLWNDWTICGVVPKMHELQTPQRLTTPTQPTTSYLSSPTTVPTESN